MRLGLLCLPFLVTVSVATAQDEVPQYAQTTADIAMAIFQGGDLREDDNLFELTKFEHSELARLEGCDGKLQPGGGESEVVIFWTCAEQDARPEFARSTSFLFDENGKVIGLAINSIGESAPVSLANNDDSERISRGTIANDFGHAVVAGSDASLGGLIPLDEFETARLSSLNANSFSIVRRTGSSFRIVALGSESGITQSVWIRFDDAGYPNGIDFGPRYDPKRSAKAKSADRAKRIRERAQDAVARNRDADRRRSRREGSSRTRELCPTC